MSWTWTNFLDGVQLLPGFPILMAIAAAAAVAIILVITLSQSGRSPANIALAIVAVLALGLGAVLAFADFSTRPDHAAEIASAPGIASVPALACLDELAGDQVLAQCEGALFSSPQAVAASVSYTAAQLARLASFGGGAATALEARSLRLALARDRYGFVAHVLTSRDGCTETVCPAFASIGDRARIVANMRERTYDGHVSRHSASWIANLVEPAGAVLPDAPGFAANGVPNVSTGTPTNADFPTSASIPPISIMNPEPAASQASRAPAPSVPQESYSEAAPAPTPQPRPAPPAAKQRQKAAPAVPPAPPVQLSP